MMEIISVIKVHSSEDCTIEGYKGMYNQWEIKTDGANYSDVLELCQKFCREESHTKKEFLEGLNYALSLCNDGYRTTFPHDSFYELEDKGKDKDKPWIHTWVYTWKYVPQAYV